MYRARSSSNISAPARATCLDFDALMAPRIGRSQRRRAQSPGRLNTEKRCPLPDRSHPTRGPAPVERVVLLDDTGNRVGEADKATVHTIDTPLHLAFSCHLFDGDGRMLMTRRALSKKTWPGVWTNSFCGHPAPGEVIDDAIARRAEFELGAQIRSITPILPNFRYRAVDASGIVENEVCPVYRADLVGGIAPNPLEVAEFAWVSVEDLQVAVGRAPWAFSPWLNEQLMELEEETR